MKITPPSPAIISKLKGSYRYHLLIKSGKDIKIEERDENEMKYMNGVPIIHELSPVLNHAFDITPAELITGIITDRGIYKPGELLRLNL